MTLLPSPEGGSRAFPPVHTLLLRIFSTVLRADYPMFVSDLEFDETQTQAIPAPDRFGTYWMPATQKIPPSRDFASAAGAMTLVQDRQALLESGVERWEQPVPEEDHRRTLAPWGEVIRSMTHDVKSLLFLPMIVIAGLLVMIWIFTVNGPDSLSYTVRPRLSESVSGAHSSSSRSVQPSQRHRKPGAPLPSPTKTQPRQTPAKPSPTRSATHKPSSPVTQEPSPTPKPSHPKPTPEPTQSPSPTPSETTPDPDPQPSVVPPTRTPEPASEPSQKDIPEIPVATHS